MNTKLLSFVFSLVVAFLFVQAAQSQVQFKVPITVASGTSSQVLNIGVSGDGPGGIQDNTVGADTDPSFGLYQELLAPPAPPAPFDFDSRIVTIPGRSSGFPTGLGGGVFGDFRGFSSASQVDSFKITIAGDFTDNGNTTLSWPNNLNLYGTIWTIKPQTATDWPTTNMLTSTSVVIPAGASKNIIIIKTGATSPSPGPNFAMSPASLDFGSVAIPGNVVRTVTVTNTGSTNPLSITGVTSIANYTVSPSVLPISVAAGASQTFTLTFTPAAAGTFAGNIVFAHNATGSPSNLAVTGVGVQIVPVSFELSPASLNFGTVPNGGSASQTVTVHNGGATTALNISAVTLPSTYTISPSVFPVSVAPGANQLFTVTFAPTDTLAHNGNVVFTHNAPNSPTNLAVTGSGMAQGGTLQFAASARVRLDHTNNYFDSLQLTYGGVRLKAVQFWMVLKGLTRIRSVAKGASLSDSVAFDYTIAQGPLAADSSRNDTVKAVFYGSGNHTLAPGTYSNVMKFAYDVVNLTTDSVRTTSIDLIRVFSSLADGSSAGVTGGGSQQITVLNKTRVFHGDVNGDDSIDILDLLKIVDHIIERQLLTGRSFTAADVYQWPNGDGVVNVQDLAVLQNMILTGQYPDGMPISRPVVGGSTVVASSNGQTEVDARIVFHVTSSGIDVSMVNRVAVRGMQVDFGSLASAPDIINITTLLGQGFHHFAENSLRVLLYNQAGYSVLEPGDRIVARIPFSISNPAALRLGNLVLASADNNRITNIETAISLNPTSVSEELPVDFALDQNYPNPFNPSTTVRFQVPVTGQVRVSIFNTLGQEVRTLFEGVMERGTTAVQFDGKDNNGKTLSSGMYLYKMTAGNFIQSRKMMFLK